MNNNEKEFIKTLQDLTQKLDKNGGERKFIIDYIKKYFQISVSFIPLVWTAKQMDLSNMIIFMIISTITVYYVVMSIYEYKTYDKNISVKEAEKTYELIQELVLAGEKSKIDILICLYREHKYIDIITNDIVDVTTNQTTRIIKIKSDYYEREWTYIL